MDHLRSCAAQIGRSLFAAALALAPLAAKAQVSPPAPASDPAPAQPPAAPPSTGAIKGAAAWQALVGNTVVVEGRAANYSEFFTADGAVKHLDKDGKATGKWNLQGQKVCFDYPDEDERSCVDVEVEGTTGAFVDEDGSRDVFEIRPGNARNL